MIEPRCFSPDGMEVDALAFLPREGSPPAIACTTSDARLACFSIDGDGGTSLSWERTTASRAWQLHALHRPAGPGEPCILAGREDGVLLACTADGTPAWSHQFGATVSAFHVFGDPDTGSTCLLVPALDRTLRLLDAGGKLAWGDTFQSGVNVARAGMAGDGIHALAAGGNDNTLRLYTRPAGAPAGSYTMAWYHKFEGYVRDVDITSAGHVAAVADDGFVKVLSASDGKVRWQHEHGSFGWKCKILDEMVLSTSYQVPVAAGEDGEALGNPGTITCHALRDGSLSWESTPADGLNVNAWDAARTGDRWLLAAGTTSGEVVVLDAATGARLVAWSNDTLVNDVRLHGTVTGETWLGWCVERAAGSARVARVDSLPET